MVGDGVNDAPAMANATVGIAMGAAGSDVTAYRDATRTGGKDVCCNAQYQGPLMQCDRHDSVIYVRYSRHMDIESSVATLSALAQPTRLEVFRLLMRSEPNGLPAGEIAKLLGVPHNTMSTHLNILNRTGLVSSERDGRSIVYRVDLSEVRGFFVYLLKDCCDGRPELCQPLLDDLIPCCQPTGAACA